MSEQERNRERAETGKRLLQDYVGLREDVPDEILTLGRDAMADIMHCLFQELGMQDAPNSGIEEVWRQVRIAFTYFRDEITDAVCVGEAE